MKNKKKLVEQQTNRNFVISESNFSPQFLDLISQPKKKIEKVISIFKFCKPKLLLLIIWKPFSQDSLQQSNQSIIMTTTIIITIRLTNQIEFSPFLRRQICQNNQVACLLLTFLLPRSRYCTLSKIFVLQSLGCIFN